MFIEQIVGAVSWKVYLSKILEKHLCADFMYYCNKNPFSAFSEISGIAFWKYT